MDLEEAVSAFRELIYDPLACSIPQHDADAVDLEKGMANLVPGFSHSSGGQGSALIPGARQPTFGRYYFHSSRRELRSSLPAN
jgi:hypothetical protein